jgi:protein phosphatase
MPACGRTHLGLVRARNEDYYYLDPVKGLYIVADGMGGHQAGDVASRLAADSIAQFIDSNWDPPGELLRKAILHANLAVYYEALKIKANHGMGTTVAIGLIANGRLYSAHVGDSRIYLIRQGQVTALTSDHSLVVELIKRGELTETAALGHPQKNVLTRALGIAPQVEIDTSETLLFPEDYILLCSDGLSGALEKDELGQIVGQETDLQRSLNILINLALDRGGLDNITAVLVRYDK